MQDSVFRVERITSLETCTCTNDHSYITVTSQAWVTLGYTTLRSLTVTTDLPMPGNSNVTYSYDVTYSYNVVECNGKLEDYRQLSRKTVPRAKVKQKNKRNFLYIEINENNQIQNSSSTCMAIRSYITCSPCYSVPFLLISRM
ncbi:hypothetical protein J6590_009926 [Homalodisca vitripennis]|nr:hypothetical protein J6590_009926 [Homalodisca vitripennis]